jgi:hypothetical protein
VVFFCVLLPGLYKHHFPVPSWLGQKFISTFAHVNSNKSDEKSLGLDDDGMDVTSFVL